MIISDLGPFKKIEAPPDWRRSTIRVPLNNRLDLPLTLLTIPGKEEDFEIGIFYRGKLESEEDGENFQALLSQQEHAGSALSLSPGQLRSLSRVLDLTGFNQYSHSLEKSGYAPEFMLRSAQVIVINKRCVLKIDGEFRADETPDAQLLCIYVAADKRGRKIFELYLKATDREAFLRLTPVFRQVCQTIEWSEPET